LIYYSLYYQIITKLIFFIFKFIISVIYIFEFIKILNQFPKQVIEFYYLNFTYIIKTITNEYMSWKFFKFILFYQIIY